MLNTIKKMIFGKKESLTFFLGKLILVQLSLQIEKNHTNANHPTILDHHLVVKKVEDNLLFIEKNTVLEVQQCSYIIQTPEKY